MGGLNCSSDLLFPKTCKSLHVGIDKLSQESSMFSGNLASLFLWVTSLYRLFLLNDFLLFVLLKKTQFLRPGHSNVLVKYKWCLFDFDLGHFNSLPLQLFANGVVNVCNFRSNLLVADVLNASLPLPITYLGHNKFKF